MAATAATARHSSKGPSKASRSGSPANGKSRRRELLGLCLLGLGLLFFFALTSYDPKDPSLNAVGRSHVRNWIGPLGAYFADLSHQLLGYGAYGIAWIPVAFGVAVLIGRDLRNVALKLCGFILLSIVASAFSQFLRGGRAGGWVGATLIESLSSVVGQVGAAIVLGVGVLVLAVGTLNLSFMKITLFFAKVGEQLTAFAANLSLDALRTLRDRFEQWQKDRREQKKLNRQMEAEDKRERKAAEQQARLDDKLRRAQGLTGNDKDHDADERRGPTMGSPAIAQPTPSAARAHSAPATMAGPAGNVALAKAPMAAKVAAKIAPRFEVDSPNEARAAGTPYASDAAYSDEDPSELGNTSAAARGDLDGPGELGMWPDVPEVLKKDLGEWGTGDNQPDVLLRAAAGPLIVDPRPEVKIPQQKLTQPALPLPRMRAEYELPPIGLLDFDAPERAPIDSESLLANAKKLERKLKDYGIDGSVVEIRPGPVVTMYEFLPAPGVKVSKIASLSDDLAMAMEAMRVRIVAPIPGKGVVGIEIPNVVRETVYLKEIVSHEEFAGSDSKLTLAIGKDIEGKPYVADLARCPHLLVAGATGTGKSVTINAMVLSLLYRATPEEVRLIMVDPKMLELSIYEGIPHLLLPVVTDPKKAALALHWAVEEMERRYALLSEAGVRNILGYNKKVEKMLAEGITTVTSKDGEDTPRKLEKLPYIVVLIDELADLMMVASRDVETSICRLAQMARAAGIHLILATQRPSVDVITGVIKANFPARISFQVASKHDSRTIIDGNGAENLLGMGDMLMIPPGAGGLQRLHGAYCNETEIHRVVEFLKKQGTPVYDENILKPRDDGEESEAEEDDFADDLYDQAVAIVADMKYASVSMLQRKMRIGYNRAARLVEKMERQGVVGPGDGAKPREVLISNSEGLSP